MILSVIASALLLASVGLGASTISRQVADTTRPLQLQRIDLDLDALQQANAVLTGPGFAAARSGHLPFACPMGALWQDAIRLMDGFAVIRGWWYVDANGIVTDRFRPNARWIA